MSQITLQELDAMKKAELIDYVRGAAEEYGVGLSDHSDRDKKEVWHGLALEIGTMSGELVNVTDAPAPIDLTDDPAMQEEFEEDWEYEEPNKPTWMQDEDWDDVDPDSVEEEIVEEIADAPKKAK